MNATSCSGDLRRGHDRDRERADEQHGLQDALNNVEVGQAAGVVLPPVPERPRRVAAELVADGAVPERRDLVQRVRVEEDDREDGERPRDKSRGEAPVRAGPSDT